LVDGCCNNTWAWDQPPARKQPIKRADRSMGARQRMAPLQTVTPPSQTALPLTDPDICARWFSIHDRCKAVYGQRLP
jgi:hypothetical protein